MRKGSSLLEYQHTYLNYMLSGIFSGRFIVIVSELLDTNGTQFLVFEVIHLL